MFRVSMIFGVLLVALGAGLYFQTTSPTALIPAAFGAVLILCGLIARNEKARMHAMHAASLVGFIGFVMPLVMVVRRLSSGQEFNPWANGGQLAMAGLCGIFLGLCVKSFVDIRLSRKAQSGTPS